MWWNLGEPGTSSYFRAEDGTIQMACSDCVIAGSVNALDDAWSLTRGEDRELQPLDPLARPGAVRDVRTDSPTEVPLIRRGRETGEGVCLLLKAAKRALAHGRD